MKASQFSDAQKAFIFKQGNDGVPVADICRRAGISQAERYEGLQPPEMRRLKQLEDENTKLKRSWRASRWIARCFKTSSVEKSEACSEARAGDDGLR